MLSRPRQYSVGESTRFVGLETITPSSFNPAHDPNGTQIQALFASLREQLREASIDLGDTLYGISCPADDVVPPQLIRYFAGVASTSALSGELIELTVPAGDYFAVSYQGPITALDAAFVEIYGPIFEASGFAMRSGLHMEMYPSSWNPDDEASVMDILLPIAPPNEG